MYIYRAINDFDEKIDFVKNGLIAKSIINSIIRNDFEFLVYATYIGKENNPFFYMKENEKEKIYREVRKYFDLNIHMCEIKRKADKNQKEINDIFLELINNQNLNYIRKILDILSTKNGHITKGSTIDYPWISFTTSLEKTRHYYENQKKNIVAVVDSNIDKFYDSYEGGYLFALDLSSDEKIRNNEFIINEDKTSTRLNYRGLNYSKKDKEVIYYNRVPKEKIVAVLKPLQYELLLLGILDEEYYNFSDCKKNYWKMIILASIRRILKEYGDIVNYIFEEYYVQNRSLKLLSETGKYTLEELNKANEFILNKIQVSSEIRQKIKFK